MGGDTCMGREAQSLGVLHVRGATGVGQEQRLPVGWADLCVRSTGRASGGDAVGPRSRLPMGREDMCKRCCGRAPGGAAVVEGARVPLGRVHSLKHPQEGTLIYCGGRRSTTAHG